MNQYDVNKLSVQPVTRATAKDIVKRKHYMKTFPAGSKLFIGIYHEGFKGVMGIAVFGSSTGTESKCKLFPNVDKENIIEMQRLWVDDLMGHNAESKILSLMMALIKKHAPQIKVVWTYAGGCKNDCGIVYQSSGFMFLGSEKCNDFYLTKDGEYKNIINVLRFGKALKELKTVQEKAEYVYGEGKMIEANRHYYFYPICKAVRRKMASKTKPFPKFSAVFRKDQKWINGEDEGRDNQ